MCEMLFFATANEQEDLYHCFGSFASKPALYNIGNLMQEILPSGKTLT